MTDPSAVDLNGHPVTAADKAKVKHAAAISSILVNIFLLAIKVAVGVITGSIALLASAADSLLDLTSSLFAYVGVRVGSRPPDDTHSYGHEKFESLSSLVQLALLFVTVGVVAAEAARRLGQDVVIDTPLYGVGVIVVGLGLAWWMSRRLAHAAKISGGSQALEADALHFATDVWSNAAVIAGLIATDLGYPIADPIAALLIAVFVAVTAVGLLRRTTKSLTDRAPDPEVVAEIRDVIEGIDHINSYHTLRARLVGSGIFLDVCIELDASLTFQAAHDLTHDLQDALREAVPDIVDAVIHFEPTGHPTHQDEEHHAHGFDALT